MYIIKHDVQATRPPLMPIRFSLTPTATPTAESEDDGCLENRHHPDLPMVPPTPTDTSNCTRGPNSDGDDDPRSGYVTTEEAPSTPGSPSVDRAELCVSHGSLS